MTTHSLEKFISEVRRVWTPLRTETVESCQKLIEELARTDISEPWLHQLITHPQASTELYQDPQHGFLLLAHTENEGLYRAPHDHGNGWVIYAVQSGEMEMRTYKEISSSTKKTNLVRRETYLVKPGESKVYLPGDIHDTRCLSPSNLIFRLTSADFKDEIRNGKMKCYLDVCPIKR